MGNTWFTRLGKRYSSAIVNLGYQQQVRVTNQVILLQNYFSAAQKLPVLTIKLPFSQLVISDRYIYSLGNLMILQHEHTGVKSCHIFQLPVFLLKRTFHLTLKTTKTFTKQLAWMIWSSDEQMAFLLLTYLHSLMMDTGPVTVSPWLFWVTSSVVFLTYGKPGKEIWHNSCAKRQANKCHNKKKGNEEIMTETIIYNINTKAAHAFNETKRHLNCSKRKRLATLFENISAITETTEISNLPVISVKKNAWAVKNIMYN